MGEFEFIPKYGSGRRRGALGVEASFITEKQGGGVKMLIGAPLHRAMGAPKEIELHVDVAGQRIGIRPANGVTDGRVISARRRVTVTSAFRAALVPNPERSTVRQAAYDRGLDLWVIPLPTTDEEGGTA